GTGQATPGLSARSGTDRAESPTPVAPQVLAARESQEAEPSRRRGGRAGVGGLRVGDRPAVSAAAVGVKQALRADTGGHGGESVLDLEAGQRKGASSSALCGAQADV